MPILALILCFASGYLVVALAWPSPEKIFSEAAMKASLAAGFGLGIFSLEFFLVRFLGNRRLTATDASCLALLLLIYYFRRRRPTLVITQTPSLEDIPLPGWLRRILVGAFLIAMFAAVYNIVLRVMVHPHGDGWDAFSIWNLHARFLFLGGEHWRDGFNSLIPWSHPDYPLLLPAAIAHFWSYLGHDDTLVPALIGIVFTFSTLALLMSSLAESRGKVAALLAGLTLLSTPFFVEQGTSQYADVPLSFFILAALVLLRLGSARQPNGVPHKGALLLAGLSAGFAAWTKNEGLLFFFDLVIALLWLSKVRQRWGSASTSRTFKGIGPFLSGAAPLLAGIAYFKHFVAASGDLLSSPDIMIHKLLTPGRYWVTAQWFGKEFLRFGEWWIIPGTIAMLAFYLLTPSKQTRSRNPVIVSSALAICLTLAGYFVIYLITPRDLYWHLRFSLNRLFLQLWPAGIFLFFLSVAHPAISPVSQTEPEIQPKRA